MATKVRGLFTNSPAIAISMLALFFALGSGAGYAANAASGTTKPVWHNLKLDRPYTGSIKYTIINGVVYLTGTARSSGRSLILARLPPALRPASELDIVVGLGSEGDGAISVPPNGRLRVYALKSHITFVSLDGVSFAIG